MVYLGLFNGFITIYYNQMLGLSNTLIGVAIMLAMIADAITDPVIGIVSDKWRSRYGRRHPFLFVAPLPLAIAIYFIFNPPAFLSDVGEGVPQMALFAWLSVWTVLSRAFLTLYQVPHLALGGELTSDQHQRSQLFSANTVIGYVSGALFSFVLWSFFFAGERVRDMDGQMVPGHLDPAAYGPPIFLACALIIIAIWVCAAGTYKYVPFLSQALDEDTRLTPKKFAAQLLSTFRNKSYVALLLGYFFFMIASGIYDTLHVFVNTYFWELQPEQIRWIGLAAAPAVMLGALLSPVLMRRYDRKPVLLCALFGTAVFSQLTIDLRLLGWMPANDSSMLLPILIANTALFVFTLGLAGVAIMSMIGDIIDENELETGLRQEGLYYSARAFFAKASYSFGHFFAGVALDFFVRMPFEAIPGQIDSDVILRLGFAAGPAMGLAAAVSLMIYGRYNLPRERHAKILRLLRERAESRATR